MFPRVTCSEELVELTLTGDNLSRVVGDAPLYRVLVSAAVASCYRGRGGARRLALQQGGRAALFQELAKLIYLLRAHPSFSQLEQGLHGSSDLDLQVTAMHVLLGSSESEQGEHSTNSHLFACRLSCLQLLMVVASSDPAHFVLALQRLAQSSHRVAYSLSHWREGKGGGGATEALVTIDAPALLVPLLRALLGVLELQLLETGCAVRGGLGAMVSGATGARLIPVLVQHHTCVFN